MVPMGRGFVASWLVMDAALSRSVRVRFYREVVCDAGRTFRLSSDVDFPAARKRAALTAVPKVEGWTLRVFTVERTARGERVGALLNRLARREMGVSTSPPGWQRPSTGAVPFQRLRPGDATRTERLRSQRAGRGPGHRRVTHPKAQPSRQNSRLQPACKHDKPPKRRWQKGQSSFNVELDAAAKAIVAKGPPSRNPTYRPHRRSRLRKGLRRRDQPLASRLRRRQRAQAHQLDLDSIFADVREN
jgi:hypothetical protein